MKTSFQPLQLLLMIFSGWVNRHQHLFRVPLLPAIQPPALLPLNAPAFGGGINSMAGYTMIIRGQISLDQYRDCEVIARWTA